MGGRPLSVLAILLAFLPGCKSTSPYPIESIELCGGGCISGKDKNDHVLHTAGLEHTVTWGGERLNPVVHEQASKNRLIWDPAFQNQELIALSIDHSSAIPPRTCGPQDCFAPISHLKFASLMGHSASHHARRTKDYDLDTHTTGQIIRYDHGACRVSRSLDEIFELMSQGLSHGFDCAQRCVPTSQFERVMEEFQPHFTGQVTDIRHGIEFSAHYHADVFGPVIDVDITMNPAYELDVSPDTGLLRVKEIQKRVIAVDDSFDKVKHTVEKQLDEVPGLMERTFEDELTFRLPTTAIPCDSDASLKTQQETCFTAVTTPLGNGHSAAYEVFRQTFRDDGRSATAADKAARQAEKGLQRKNFVCAPRTDTAPEGCAFRPVFQRVHVLPRNLEFVLADTFDEDRIKLYEALGLILHSGHPPDWLPAQICRPVGDRSDGEVTYVVHHSHDLGDPPPANQCPPCP